MGTKRWLDTRQETQITPFHHVFRPEFGRTTSRSFPEPLVSVPSGWDKKSPTKRRSNEVYRAATQNGRNQRMFLNTACSEMAVTFFSSWLPLQRRDNPILRNLKSSLYLDCFLCKHVRKAWKHSHVTSYSSNENAALSGDSCRDLRKLVEWKYCATSISKPQKNEGLSFGWRPKKDKEKKNFINMFDSHCELQIWIHKVLLFVWLLQ